MADGIKGVAINSRGGGEKKARGRTEQKRENMERKGKGKKTK